MASLERDKEGFTVVDRRRKKKRKAGHSPLLHTPPGSSSTSSPGTPTRLKPSNFDYPNTVPVVFRDADPNFKTFKQVMSKLSQHDPELRVSRAKDLPNKGFFIIGNTPRDVLTLQSENKMKACLDQNLKISLRKPYQIKEKSKTFIVKGVPIEFTDNEFKEILDYNKIQYTKAERMKSRKEGRSLQMFQIELEDPAEAEAKLFQITSHAHRQELFLRWKSFVLQSRSGSVITAKISDTRPKSVRQKLNVSSVEKATHTKDAQGLTKKQVRPRLHNPRVTRSLLQPIS